MPLRSLLPERSADPVLRCIVCQVGNAVYLCCEVSRCHIDVCQCIDAGFYDFKAVIVSQLFVGFSIVLREFASLVVYRIPIFVASGSTSRIIFSCASTGSVSAVGDVALRCLIFFLQVLR